MTAPLLEVTDLQVRIAARIVLETVNLTLRAGERVVVLGASGSGKTTLLRTMAGLAEAGAGSVRIAGADVTTLPAEQRGAVYLHQAPLLFPHLSVAGNVAFPLHLRRAPAEEIRETVARLLRQVHLDGIGDRMPATLSGGQRHRVALARALAARPSVLLLDEPLTSLDPPLRSELRALLLHLQEEYRPAIVLASHDLEDAATLGDQVMVLGEGRVAQLGAAADVFHHPATLAVARFIGLPNLVPGMVEDNCFRSVLGEWKTRGPIANGRASAAFGADAVRLVRRGGVRAVVAGCRHGPGLPLLTLRVGSLALHALVTGRAVPPPGAEIEIEVEPALVSHYPGGAGV